MVRGALEHKKMENIDEVSILSEQMQGLLASSDYTDVTFVVEDEKIQAHRAILVARSRIFEKLLYVRDSVGHEAKEIRLDVPYKAFKTLLQYIYSGKLSLSEIGDTAEVLDLLVVSHKYEFSELKKLVLAYLEETFTASNVCKVLEVARRHSFESLVDKSHKFMDKNAVAVLEYSSLLDLSLKSLCSVLERDTFYAPELDIFNAVLAWIEINPDVYAKKVLPLVRLEVMDVADLMKAVHPTEKFEPLKNVIQRHALKEYFNYRYIQVVDQNIAAKKRGVQVVEGVYKEALFDGSLDSFTSHTIGENRCIMVQLGDVYIINHLKIFLWSDSLVQCYAYYVEVSVDRNIWKRVVDFSNFCCRYWQDLYFAPVAVKYIRIVGTSARIENQFKCSAFEAYFSRDIPHLENGLYARTIKLERPLLKRHFKISELLAEGFNISKGVYFNENLSTVRIELNQPFLIDSFSLLMNLDAASFPAKLYVGDYTKWTQLEHCKIDRNLWHFSCDPQPVCMICITEIPPDMAGKLRLIEFEYPSSFFARHTNQTQH